MDKQFAVPGDVSNSCGCSGPAAAPRFVACLLVAMLPGLPAPADAREAGAENSFAGNQRHRIGLVLSGGGARGAAHAGVLKVLEELRVPISCIAGTSMGAIVGAGYASGTSVRDMEEMVASISTEVLLSDKAPREELPIRRKQDDRVSYVGPELGVTAGGLSLQKGVVSGVALEALLRQLSRAKGYYDFDRLPIPFRAVATDIETGEPVILRSGSLASAMRASMAVPAAVAPAEVDGRMLVDGMLTRNLPVDVARELCADVIIAVNVGTPLMKREQLGSILGITGQMVSILTEQNVQRSLQELRPGDILITPELDGFTTSDFDRLRQIIPRGETAARAKAAELSRYSIGADEYGRFRERQSVVAVPDNRPVDEIRVESLKRVNPVTVIDAMETKAGEPLDPALLDQDMRRIYGRGDFEHVSYRLIEDKGKRVLTVDALEKPWGPDYLRFGLSLSSDLGSNSFFNLLGTYRKAWLNALGAEWRTDLQVGRTSRLETQFYQPLDSQQRFFVVPQLSLQRTPVDLFAGEDRIARFNTRTLRLGVDVGTQLTRWGEIRLGVSSGRADSSLDTGVPQFTPNPSRVDLGAVTTKVLFDQLDNVAFPRKGFGAGARLYSSHGSLGADQSYGKWDADFVAAHSFGDHTFQIALKGGGPLRGRLPAYDQFSLGGFLQLSGLQTFQLYGERMAFGRLVYANRLQRQTLFSGVYAGVSLEAGRIPTPLVPTNEAGVILGGSIFLTADTPLGPVYLAYGRTDSGSNAVYFLLGVP